MVSKASKFNSWGTIPIKDLAFRYCFFISSSSTVIVPSSKFRIPQTVLINVDFPAPLGPSKANISPLLIFRLSESNAWNLLLYTFDTLDILRISDIL